MERVAATTVSLSFSRSPLGHGLATSARFGWVYRGSIEASAACHDGNRLYLDKLIRITENRYAKQCAGRIVVAETPGDFVPRHNEIVSIAARNIDRRLEDVTQFSATLFQRNSEVGERLARLRGDITWSNYSPLDIERARTRGDDQAGLSNRRGVCIRHARKKPVAAHKFCCHANRVCHSHRMLIAAPDEGRGTSLALDQRRAQSRSWDRAGPRRVRDVSSGPTTRLDHQQPHGFPIVRFQPSAGIDSPGQTSTYLISGDTQARHGCWIMLAVSLAHNAAASAKPGHTRTVPASRRRRCSCRG